MVEGFFVVDIDTPWVKGPVNFTIMSTLTPTFSSSIIVSIVIADRC